MADFYSHGKLLITSEYAVLDGAKALALPTKFGQSLNVKENNDNCFRWKSFDEENKIWFEADFEISNLDLKLIASNDKSIADTLVQIIEKATVLSQDRIVLNGISVETHLEFNKNWGLGTSSTLINNIASWFQINAFELLDATLGGSGYDIACAQNPKPIKYQLVNGLAKVTPVDVNWSFKGNLYFVYLNKKQNSRSGILDYRSRNLISTNQIERLNAISDELLQVSQLEAFEELIIEHNYIVSKLVGLEPIAKTHFTDFSGTVKNLGAWGGDFVLVTSKTNPKTYFQEKGFKAILPYKNIILE